MKFKILCLKFDIPNTVIAIIVLLIVLGLLTLTARYEAKDRVIYNPPPDINLNVSSVCPEIQECPVYCECPTLEEMLSERQKDLVIIKKAMEEFK